MRYQTRSDPIVQYYVQQSGRGLPFPVFSAPSFQRGFGGLFSGLFRFFKPVIQALKPMAQSILPTVGKELARAGSGVVSDIVSGQNVGDSLKKRFSTAGEELRDKACSSMSQSGSGLIKRKRPLKRLQFVKRRRSKRTKGDIFL